jgi:hypothetical protein
MKLKVGSVRLFATVSKHAKTEHRTIRKREMKKKITIPLFEKRKIICRIYKKHIVLCNKKMFLIKI